MKITKKQRKLIIRSAITIIIIVIGLAFGVLNKQDIETFFEINDASRNATSSNNIEINDEDSFKVTKVVDGDTIEIEYKGQNKNVRFIGIDTPESVHPDKEKNSEYGKTASEYTKKLLLNKIVSIELDVQSVDKYGRILAYVYLDGEMINKKLLQEGYAKVATYPPNVKYEKQFVQIQKQAREESKGFWGEKVFK